MPLPIVLGGKSVSAQSLPGFKGRYGESDDGVLLSPVELYQSIGWGVCPQSEWLVRVTCSYYDLVDPTTGSRGCTMVEVRIQVSPMTRPLSLEYRETSHHLKLSDGAKDEYPTSQPQVVVSADRRNLAVLIFHPHQQSSALVLFQLRKPRSDLSTEVRTSSNPIPIPHYIQKVGNDNAKDAELNHRDPPAVATHPRFVSVWGISAIGCLPPNVNPSVFLAACQDGSLVWLDARSSMAVAAGHLPLSTQQQQDYLPLASIRPAPSSEMNVGQVLLVTKQGQALLVSWQIENTTKMQQTFLKRASTGTVVTEPSMKISVQSTNFQPLRPTSPKTAITTKSLSPKPGRRSTLKVFQSPGRSKSSSSESLMDALSPTAARMRDFFRKQRPSRAGSNVSSSKDNSTTSGGGGALFDLKLPFTAITTTTTTPSTTTGANKEANKSAASATKQSIDAFALKELQKRTLSAAPATPRNSGASVGSTTTTTTTTSTTTSNPQSPGTAGPSPLLQHLHAQQEQQNPRRRRRRSEVEGQRAVDTLKRQMKLHVLSIAGGGREGGTNWVVDAHFASLPSMVCFLYQPSPPRPQKQQQQSNPEKTSSSTNRCVAQMHSISEDGTFQPLLSLTLSKEQLKDAFKIHSSRDHGSSNTNGGGTNNGHSAVDNDEMAAAVSSPSRQGLHHDPVSDTFAISTICQRMSDEPPGSSSSSQWWVGCLWNWRANALSWTIQQPSSTSLLWTRLYFAKHSEYANHLAFVECHQDKYLHIRKQTVATGLLSPPSCLPEGGVPLEANSLLMTSDSIRFPEASQLPGSEILELDWKVSTIPLNYRNMYGPPKIATSGRQHGSSIAIASSFGVCVLDRHFKWKQFGTPNEERSFQVVAMTWWEGQDANGGYTTGSSGTEEMTEDLLVAIIQSNNGRQYLSCWSPKRLDLAHQLLETFGYQPATNEDGSTQYSWGIPLVKDVKATSLSLLAEPNVKHGKRRAVVLVSATNAGTCDMDYSCYRLQVSKPRATSSHLADSYHEMKPYTVIVEHTIYGTLKNGARSVGPISSVVLAGASFDFNLNKPSGDKSKEETVATLGIVRSPGGMESVNLSSQNKAYMATLSNESEVSKITLADIICGSNLCSAKDVENHPIDAFVWTIELLTGQILCWTVPYRLRGTDSVERQMSSFLKDIQISRPVGLNPPILVCKKESREKRVRYMHGIICQIGRNSDWMQQASPGTQSDISLGLVPNSGFGCVLRAGQHARKLYRSGMGGDFDTELFARDFLESEVYGPGEFLMMPPVFVPSLYMLLLEAAHLRTELPIMEDSNIDAAANLVEDEKERLETIEKHVDARLYECRNKDAAMMALRLLILRSVEMLSQVDKKHRKAQSDISRSNLLLSLALFTEIVYVVRRCTSNLQFASLFLEVGRQIEPSFLAHLFPLPLSHSHSSTSPNARRRSSNMFVADKSVLNRFNARSVVDLFSLCIHEGSLAASASALPLLSSRKQSQSYCALLLERGITAFCHNIDSTEADFDRTLEERRVIGDIFRFGMKLEDAVKLDEELFMHSIRDGQFAHGGENNLPEDAPPPLLSGSKAGGDADGTDDESNSENYEPTNGSNRNLICVGGGGRQSTILGYVINSIFDGGASKESEDAIRRAASTFIDGKKDLASMDFLNFGMEETSSATDSEEDNDDDEDGNDDGDAPADGSPNGSSKPLKTKLSRKSELEVKSMAQVVGIQLLELLQAPKIDHPWKAIAGLARLLLQQSKEMPPLHIFTRSLQRTNQAALEAVLPTGYTSVGPFLVAEIGRCEFQIQPPAQEPGWIVELILLLLHRFEVSSSSYLSSKRVPEKIETSLVLIGLISAHVSGRVEDLLNAMESDAGTSNYLLQCYQTLQQESS